MHAIILATMLFGIGTPQQLQPMQAPPQVAHISNSFHLEVAAPLSRLAPLFGPEAERKWSGKHWNPIFLYPQRPQDTQGAVFTMQHGTHTAVWVNTIFDLSAGRMQYVYFIPDGLVTTIDVKLTSIDPSHTSVEVTYVRTALQPSANDDVRSLGMKDRESGPEWQTGIEAYLKTR